MTITTKAALADELGISRARVSQYVRAGLPVRSDGKLNRDEALNWLNRNARGLIGEDKGASRAQRLVERDRKRATVARTPIRQSAASVDQQNPFDVAGRMAVLTVLRPHAMIVAAAVLEAGGSLEVAYATAHLVHSPLIQAAGLTLQSMLHPDFQGDEHDLRIPREWHAEPDWASFAKAAGVPYDLHALKEYLDATPVWSAKGDEDPRRFDRDLTLSDVTGAPRA